MSDPTKCAGCGRQFTSGSIFDALTEGIICLPCQGVSIGGRLIKDVGELVAAREQARGKFGPSASRSEQRRKAIRRGFRLAECDCPHRNVQQFTDLCLDCGANINEV